MIISYTNQNILNKTKIRLQIRVSHFYVSNLRLPTIRIATLCDLWAMMLTASLLETISKQSYVHIDTDSHGGFSEQRGFRVTDRTRTKIRSLCSESETYCTELLCTETYCIDLYKHIVQIKCFSDPV